MDILTAEEKLARWIEGITEMPGKIYRSPLPKGMYEGFEVTWLAGRPAGINHVNEFTLQVRGIAPDREKLWLRFEKIFEALPLEKYDSFLYVDVDDKVTFSREEKEGLQVSCGTVKLAVSFV